MKNWLMRWVASALALFVITKVVPGVEAKGAPALLMAVVVMGLINSLIKPVLKFLTMPLNCVTFGLFGFVLNVALFWLAGVAVPGFDVNTAVGALIGSVLMGLLSGLFGSVLESKGDKRRE